MHQNTLPALILLWELDFRTERSPPSQKLGQIFEWNLYLLILLQIPTSNC